MTHWMIRLAAAAAILIGAFVDLAPWLRWPIVGIGLMILLYEFGTLPPPVRKQWSIWWQRGPIGWDFDGFVGGSRVESNPVQVSVFQASGVVRRSCRIKDSYIRSNVDGRRCTALMSTDAGYLSPPNLGCLRPGTTIRVQASFGGNLLPGAGGTLSVSEADFLRDWSDFSFVVEYEKSAFSHRFSPQDVKDCLDSSLPLSLRARLVER